MASEFMEFIPHIVMQFKPQAHIKTKQLFLGSIKLQAGNNVLPANKLAKLKSHPNYQYYVDLGILIPNDEEVKPTGKERAAAKKARGKKKPAPKAINENIPTLVAEEADSEAPKE